MFSITLCYHTGTSAYYSRLRVERQNAVGAAAAAPPTPAATQGTPQPFPSALPGNAATNYNTNELLWSRSHTANVQHEQLQYLLQQQHQHVLQQHHSPSPSMCLAVYNGSSNNRLGNNNSINDNAAAILAPWETTPTLPQQRWCYVTETPLNNNHNTNDKISPTANMRATPDLGQSIGAEILNNSIEFGKMDASTGIGSCMSISCSDVQTPQQQQQQQRRYFEQQLGAIASATAGGEGASGGASGLGIWGEGAGAGGAATERAAARPSEQAVQGSPKGGWEKPLFYRSSSFSTSSMGSSQDLDASEMKRQERNAREQRR